MLKHAGLSRCDSYESNLKKCLSKFSLSCFTSNSSQIDLQEMMHSRLILPSKREVGEDTKSHEK